MNLTKIAADFIRDPDYPDKAKIPAGLVPEIYRGALAEKIKELLQE